MNTPLSVPAEALTAINARAAILAQGGTVALHEPGAPENARDPQVRAVALWMYAQASHGAGQADRAYEFLAKAYAAAPSLSARLALDFGTQAYHRRHYVAAATALRAAAIAMAQGGDFDGAFSAYLHYDATLGAVRADQPGLPFDPDLFQALKAALTPLRPALPARAAGGKLRIGYVLWGEHVQNSSLVRACLSIGLHHDPATCEPVFFSILTREQLDHQSPAALAEWDSVLGRAGHQLVFAQQPVGNWASVVALAHQMAAHDLDALVFNCQTGIFLPLALLRPARTIQSLCWSDPAVYSGPALDLTHACSWHSVQESHCPAQRLHTAFDVALDTDYPAPARAALGVPDNCVLICTTASDYKYADARYWRIVVTAAQQRRHAHFLFVGITKCPFALPEDVLGQMHFLGFRHDYSGIAKAIDIYLDNVPPAGSGFALYQAMRQGKPVVMTEGDLARRFDHLHWNPVVDNMGPAEFAELILPADNDLAVAERLIRLIDDESYRRHLAGVAAAFLPILTDGRPSAAAVEESVRVACL